MLKLRKIKLLAVLLIILFAVVQIAQSHRGRGRSSLSQSQLFPNCRNRCLRYQSCLSNQCVCRDLNCFRLNRFKPVCTSQDTIGICVECISNTQCTIGSQRTCKTSTNQCVQCIGNTQCSGVQATCKISTNQCVECIDDTQCSGVQPNCKTTTNQCVQCLDDGDCTTASLTTCKASTNQCVECTEDSDCTTAGSTACKVATNQCVQCTDDTDCLAPQTCDTSDNICKCTDSQCPSGQFCDSLTAGGTCGQCRIDSHCLDFEACSASNICQCNNVRCNAAASQFGGSCDVPDSPAGVCQANQCSGPDGTQSSCLAGQLCTSNDCSCDSASCLTAGGSCIDDRCVIGTCTDISDYSSSTECGADEDFVCVQSSVPNPQCFPKNVLCRDSEGYQIPGVCPPSFACLPLSTDPEVQYSPYCQPLCLTGNNCASLDCFADYDDLFAGQRVCIAVGGQQVCGCFKII